MTGKNNNNANKKPAGNKPKTKSSIAKTTRKRPARQGPRKVSPTSVGAAVATGRSSGLTSIVIERSERIGTITSVTSAGIVLTQYVNAGNLANSTNSFLSRQAQLFDKYQFSKFEVEYVPISGTSTSGNIIIGMDISANDVPPADAVGMTNLSLGHAEGNVWRGFKFPAQCFPCFPAGPKYVRSGISQLGENASLYDMGALFVYAEGVPAGTTLGYIDVHYKVHLHGVNRNSGEDAPTLTRPVGKAVITLTGNSITPGGTYAGTSLASFSGYNVAATGFSVPTFTPAVNAIYGSWSDVTLGVNSFTLQPGKYAIRLNCTQCSDTYANAALVLKAGSTTIVGVDCGFAAATYPATAYVCSQTASSTEALVTLTTATAFALQVALSYSAGVVANKTWNLVYIDGNNVQSTSIEITRLSAA